MATKSDVKGLTNDELLHKRTVCEVKNNVGLKVSVTVIEAKDVRNITMVNVYPLQR